MKICHDSTKPNGADWNNHRIVTARACELLSVTAQDKSGAGFYLLIYDSCTDTPGTDCLVDVRAVPSGSFISINYGHQVAGTVFGREMRHGIYLAASTDPHTKTLLATNDAHFSAAYKIPA